MAGDRQPQGPSDDEQAIIDQAERMLAEQADITVSEASRRIRRYARFNELQPIEVSQAILRNAVRLLTIRENINLLRRAPDPGPRPNPE
jgi:hypothetical protein